MSLRVPLPREFCLKRDKLVEEGPLKCSKCGWLHNLTEEQHNQQCRYRYGFLPDVINQGQHHIVLTPKDIKNSLQNSKTLQIQFEAKDVLWSAEMFVQQTDNKDSKCKMLFVKVSFVKGLTEETDKNGVNICFNVYLKTDEDPKNSFITRHMFLESTKWPKGVGAVFESEIIKLSLLKSHKHDIQVFVAPTIENIDSFSKLDVRDFPNDGFTEVYRMIGTEMDRSRLKKLTWPKFKSSEERPVKISSAQKRKFEKTQKDSTTLHKKSKEETTDEYEKDANVFEKMKSFPGKLSNRIKLMNTGMKDQNENTRTDQTKVIDENDNKLKNTTHNLESVNKQNQNLTHNKTVKFAEHDSEYTEEISTPEEASKIEKPESPDFFKTTDAFYLEAEAMINNLWSADDSAKERENLMTFFNEMFDEKMKKTDQLKNN